jgi:hypothetical protein
MFSLLSLDPDHPGWPSFIKMTTEKCSERIWMVQESIINDNTIMLRGSIVLEWDMVAAVSALQRFQPLAFPGIGLSDRLESSMAMQVLWLMRKSGKQKYLVSQMALLETFQCSDPRDRVYVYK